MTFAGVEAFGGGESGDGDEGEGERGHQVDGAVSRGVCFRGGGGGERAGEGGELAGGGLPVSYAVSSCMIFGTFFCVTWNTWEWFFVSL